MLFNYYRQSALSYPPGLNKTANNFSVNAIMGEIPYILSNWIMEHSSTSLICIPSVAVSFPASAWLRRKEKEYERPFCQELIMIQLT